MSIFRPHRQPAQLFYDVFEAEAKHRKDKTVEDWILDEREAVWRAARDWAQQNGKPVPTMDMVKKAETYACGHTDYGAKWAYALVEEMQKQSLGEGQPQIDIELEEPIEPKETPYK